MKELRGDVLLARDGDLGFVVDTYFDDQHWDVRYLVVDTGHAMPERRVLIAPEFVLRDQPVDALVRVCLTRAEVERCPDPDSALPVSRQFDVSPKRRASANPHLRSGEIVIGYRIEALDGAGGRVRDLIVDASSWSVVELVVDTGSWFAGLRVRVATERVRAIDWPSRTVRVALTRDQLRRLPRA